MFKKTLISFLILILVGGFSFTGKAFIGPAIEKSIPQPVYSTPNGMELEKLIKWARTIEELYTVTKTLEQTLKQDRKDSTMMNVLLGNKELLEVYQDEDLADLSAEEWEQWVKNDINAVFSDTTQELMYMGELMQELDETTQKETEAEVSREVGENTDPVIQDFLEKSGTETEEDNEDLTNQESFQKDLENLKQKHEQGKANIAEIKYKYGSEDKEIEGSTTEFIKEEKESLNNVNENMNENVNKQSLSLAVKTISKIQMENTRINLKMLEALKDINKQLARIESKLHQQYISEEYMKIRRDHQY